MPRQPKDKYTIAKKELSDLFFRQSNWSDKQFATDPHRLGANPKDIQEHLGHSTITTTMNMYTYTTDETKKNTAGLLNERFSND